MSVRALIIAIEHYPDATAVAPHLPGTLDAAAEFAQWLCQEGQASPQDIHVCASGSAAFPDGVARYEATLAGVIAAYEALLMQGSGKTERLFVYLAGHGLEVNNDGWREPDEVLLLTDFVAADKSGNRVLFVEELRRRLALGLGPGVQFFFVDACRTDAGHGFRPQQIPTQIVRSDLGVACSHRLSSTRSGAVASTKSPFAETLLSCFRGSVPLERDDEGGHWVTLGATAEVVGRAMGSRPDSIDVQTGCLNDRLVQVAEPRDGLESLPASSSSTRVPTVSGPVPSIGRNGDLRIPPIELLVRYDRIVFLGETNSQLPGFIEKAVVVRGRKWRRIDVFSLDDYTENGRPEETPESLERERNRTEAKLYPLLAKHCDDFAMYRYDYLGIYGSLWEHDDTGMRRVHMSARVVGENIRTSPSSDFLEVPGSPSAYVQWYFDKADELIRSTRPLAGPSVIVGGSGIKERVESLGQRKDSGLTPSQTAALAKASAILADQAAGADVMSVPEHQMAALLQTYLEERAEEGDGIVGEVLGDGREVQFDDHDIAGWVGSFFMWVARLNNNDWIEPAPLAESMPNGARVAILGDWGSGLYAAPVIGKTLEDAEERYDLLVHLGDVYYSGTKRAVRKRFVAHWPNRADAVSRACNANHEMYAGGRGYFEEILPRFGQAASPFALQNDHWLVVGLDTAYDNHALHGSQAGWLNALVEMAEDRRVVLLSHHQPLSMKEKQGPKLVEALRELLEGGRIFAWYWGHEHRCVLHDKHPQWSMWGRCIGHSGYPYFRDELDGEEVHRVGDDRWVRQTGPEGVPPGIILDGPNPYVGKRPDAYGPQGYATLELHVDRLVERIHGPTAAVLYEQELR